MCRRNRHLIIANRSRRTLLCINGKQRAQAHRAGDVGEGSTSEPDCGALRCLLPSAKVKNKFRCHGIDTVVQGVSPSSIAMAAPLK